MSYKPKLTELLREEMAQNADGDNEAHLRCTCDDCVAAVRAPLVAAYKELAEAASFLPIVPDAMPGGSFVGEVVTRRFSNALHTLHVLVSQ